MSASPQVPLCRQDDSQIVVIDVQEKLTGAMPAEARRRVIRNIGTLLQASKLLDIPISLTEQYPKGLGRTESTVMMDLTPRSEIFEKTGFSCCLAEGFTDNLVDTRKRQVVVTGLEAHVCVLQTALELLAQDFEVFVVEDAVLSREAANHANAMARLRQAGVIVTNTESVLFEWMRDAKHPHFKIISSLMK